MKKSRAIAGSLIAAVGLLAASVPAIANADDGFLPDDAMSAFHHAAPAHVASAVAPDSARSTRLDDVVATVADHSVTIQSESGTLSLVALEETSGVRYQPVLMDGGSALIAVVIDSPSADNVFDFQALTSDGSRAEILESGAVAFTGPDGSFSGGLATPWARDSKGNDVPTHFEVNDSNVVSQYVDLSNVATDAYPVVADPWLGAELYGGVSVTNTSQGFIVTTKPSAWGRLYQGVGNIGMWWAHADEVKNKMPNPGNWNLSLQEQLYCHIAGWPVSENPNYDLESWKPQVPWQQQASSKCLSY
ncbi:DUF2599 domain-containing protein [Microbacterium sp. GXF6406]